jgi:hypothetical protein
MYLDLEVATMNMYIVYCRRSPLQPLTEPLDSSSNPASHKRGTLFHPARPQRDSTIGTKLRKRWKIRGQQMAWMQNPESENVSVSNEMGRECML